MTTPQLGNLQYLEQLDLWGNQLSGSIPSELGHLKRLSGFTLWNNQLSGSIPSSLTNLTNLYVDFSNPGNNGLNIGDNALTTSDSTLRDFLNQKDPDWEQTQRILSPEKLQDLPTNIPAGQVWFNPVDEAVYVYVPAGDFVMGSTQAQIDAIFSVCQPIYAGCNQYLQTITSTQPINLDGFWIMQTEVTNDQYRRFTEAESYPPPAAGWNDPDSYNSDRPVFGVSWADAVAYTTWLSRETGLTVRLPTETEWEKAARGTDGRIYPWGNEWDPSRLNYCDKNGKQGECAQDETFDDRFALVAPVGSYPQGASPYNVLDMAGNVWEWTSSLYKEYPYQATDGREDVNASGLRVRRGGSFNSMAGLVPVFLREGRNSEDKFGDMGFRVIIRVVPK